jgi:PKD repeat protein
LLTNNNIPESKWKEPGIVATNSHDISMAAGENYFLATLQACGYVAADANGAVTEAEKAPSARWKEVKFNKDSDYSLTPDTTDDYVYMDEYINFLTHKYGNASTATGVKAYGIDNEPALWVGNHPRIHPNQATCAEIVQKNIDLAKTVKRVDPYADTFGMVAYGFAELNTFQDAPDWKTLKGDYSWFLDYYLDSMKKASDTAGKRLIDVLDFHWYPEAKGGGQRVVFGSDSTNIECNKARLQAARTLWDPTYTEDSWIGQYCKDKLPLLSSVQASINKYNPGTKIGITEYSYGGDDHITGGIAQADVLGVYGKYGVYFASVWGGGAYTASGFNIYTNYDGKGGTYGDTKVKAETSDVENSSVYASVDSKDSSKLHVIMINKNYDSPMTVNFNVAGNKNYTSGRVFAFDRGSANIYEKPAIDSISGNKFSYTVPALTVCHIVLDSDSSAIIYGDANNDKVVNALDYAVLKKQLLNQDTTYNKAIDLNVDGAVNAIDFAILKQYLLGAIDKLPKINTVPNVAPVASFTVPSQATTDDKVAFDASASSDSDGKISVYAWDFGDGTEGSGVKVTHKYKVAGSYTAKLTVTDDKGLPTSISKTISITSVTGDNAKISFEDGTLQGFMTNTTAESTLSVSSDKAFRGTNSMKWVVSAADTGKADVVLNYSKPILAPGSSVTFRVWVPADAPIQAIQPYIMPHDATWKTSEWNSAWTGYASVVKNAWNEFTVTLPSTTNTDLTEQQIGIQLQATGNCTLYVDSVDW